MPVALEQKAFRFRNDDGGEAAATWKAAQNTSLSLVEDANFRLRFEIQETGGVEASTLADRQYKLRYSKNGGAWLDVLTTSDVLRPVASPHFADGAATTNQLTAGTGTFAAGEIIEAGGACTAAVIPASGHTEVEFSLNLRGADVAPGDTVALQLVRLSGTPLETYTVTPQITVGTAQTVTFGETGEMPFSFPLVGGELRVFKFTLVQEISASKLSILVTGGTAALKLKGLLYADAAGAPGTKLAEAPEITVAASSVKAWRDMPFTASVTLQPGDYWIGYLADTSNGTAFYIDNGFQFVKGTAYAGGGPSPMGTANATSAHHFSVYATGTSTAPPPAPTTRWGVSTGYPIGYWTDTERNSYYQRIYAAGFRRVRFDIASAVANDTVDKHVTSAIAAGLIVQGMIGGSPADTTTAYANRCTARADFYKTRITEWELMNEPNLQSGWGTGSVYAPVAKAGADAIKAVYAAAALPVPKIILGDISNFGAPGNASPFTPWAWLTSIYSWCAANGGSAWFDEVGYHPYGFMKNATGQQAFDNPSGYFIIEGSNPSLRSVMAANGDAAKKIHLGETGAPTWTDGTEYAHWPSTTTSDPVGMTEQAQADYLAIAIAWAKTKSYIGDVYLYSFQDRSPVEHATNREGHFGIVRNNGNEKPAHDVVQTAILTNPAQVPSNTVLPAISGTAIEGSQLVASTGTWLNDPTSYTYQWKRAGSNITGATADRYTLVAADVGQEITVTVTATNAVGSTPATSAGVTPTAATSAPTNTVAPVIGIGNPVTNPSFETNNSLWTINAANVDLVRDTALAAAQKWGGASGKITKVTTAAGYVAPVGDVGALRMGMVPGQQYTWSVWIYNPAATGMDPTRLVLQFFDRVGGVYEMSQVVIPQRDTLVRASLTRTIRAGATEAFTRVGIHAGDAIGKVVYIDGAQLDPGPVALPYRDGAQPGASWEGTAHASRTLQAAHVGNTLSVFAGTWTGTGPNTFTYQWQRNSGTAGAFVNIAGATGPTYLLTADDFNYRVRCVVTATSPFGSATANSNQAGPVTVLAPVNTVVPTITPATGLAVGSVLDATTGTWSNSPTAYAYQWKRAGSAIQGAVSARYVVQAADAGVAITVTVTATNLGGQGQATSAATSAVPGTPPAPPGGSTTLTDTDAAAIHTALAAAITPGPSSFPALPTSVWQAKDSELIVAHADTQVDLWTGYTERYPIEWALRRSRVNFQAVDLLALLAQWDLQSIAMGEMASDSRIWIILDRIGWAMARRRLDWPQEWLKARTTTEGAKSELDRVAVSENGAIFADASGNLVFHSRDHRLTDPRSIVPQAVFGDGGPTTGELPYIGSPVVEYDLQKVINDATVSGQQYEDTISRNSYGRHSVSRDSDLATPEQALAQATAIVARNKDPKLRFLQLRVDLKRDPRLPGVMLGLRFADRITVKHRPPEEGVALENIVPVVRDCWIERTTHSIVVSDEQGKDEWTVTLDLTSVL